MRRKTQTATRWAQWQDRGLLSTPGVGETGGAAPLPGVPILDGQFPNSALRLVVEFAFGATLSADPATWTWTDVTTDVMIADGRKIVVQQGKQDARSTSGPAQLTFTLDNRTNRYSRSPLSLNWPYFRRGTPVRARVILNGAEAQSYLLFQGRAAGFQPTWDSTGKFAVTSVTAAGVFRALGQGNQALFSVLRQYIPQQPNIVAYWPMEDPSDAVSLAAYTPSTEPIVLTGSINVHSDSSAVASDSLPVFASGSGIAFFPFTNTGVFQFRALVSWPVAASALPDQTVVFRIKILNSSTTTYDILYAAGGMMRLISYSNTTVLFDSGNLTFGLDGTAGFVNLSCSTSGSDVAVTFSNLPAGVASATSYSTTITGQLVGVPTSVQLFPVATTNASVAIGHLHLQSQASDVAEYLQLVNAYDGEYTHVRVQRLAQIMGYSVGNAYGDGVSIPGRVGPQRVDSALNLMREAEATDGGVLYDGHGDSIAFQTHLYLENLSPIMTLDATAQLVPPFAPMDDDQQLRNQWTVSQRNGPDATYTNTDPMDPQSTVNAGLYGDSVTINVFGNANTEVGVQTGAFGYRYQQALASWLVHRDTPDGYRIPAFQLAFHRNPELLLPFVSNTFAGSAQRMDVTNLSTVYPQMEPWTHQFLMVGFTHTIDQFLWDIALNVSPYDPWHVGVIAAPSGDTGVNVMRVDTVGSTLAAAADAGAATLSVSSTDKGLWTTAADDFPLTVKIGGIPVTVTNITGAASPQTFTVDPATVIKPLPASSDVRLWNPPVIAIGGVS